jgi:hypothetical protein
MSVQIGMSRLVKPPDFIKTTPENPVLWTGMKGASAESRKNNSDAETSSA